MISINGKGYSLPKLLAAGAAVVAVTGGAIGYGMDIVSIVPHVAWQSQAGHDADLAHVDQEVARVEGLLFDETSILHERLTDLIERSETREMCSQYQDELDALLANGTLTPIESARMAQVQDIMGSGNLNCTRFEIGE